MADALRRKWTANLDEFFSIEDEAEAVLCVRELHLSPAALVAAVGEGVQLSLERGAREQRLFVGLLCALQRCAVLSAAQLEAGVGACLLDDDDECRLADMAIDVPRAPADLCTMLQQLAARGAIGAALATRAQAVADALAAGGTRGAVGTAAGSSSSPPPAAAAAAPDAAWLRPLREFRVGRRALPLRLAQLGRSTAGAVAAAVGVGRNAAAAATSTAFTAGRVWESAAQLCRCVGAPRCSACGAAAGGAAAVVAAAAAAPAAPLGGSADAAGDDFPLQGVRVLELGSGTGVCGIACALLGADVLLTDLEAALPLLEVNVGSNAAAIGAAGGNVRVQALRWGEAALLPDIRAAAPFDLVIGSDVVFRFCASSFRDLATSLQELLRPPPPPPPPHHAAVPDGGGGAARQQPAVAAPPVALLSYKPRFPRAEQEFFDELGPRGLACEPLQQEVCAACGQQGGGAEGGAGGKFDAADGAATGDARGVNDDIRLLLVRREVQAADDDTHSSAGVNQ
jgi:hypothetical protein